MEKFINRKIELAIEQLQEGVEEINEENFDSVTECYRWIDVAGNLQKAIYYLQKIKV